MENGLVAMLQSGINMNNKNRGLIRGSDIEDDESSLPAVIEENAEEDFDCTDEQVTTQWINHKETHESCLTNTAQK